MTKTGRPVKSFCIELLEERIAPGVLAWGAIDPVSAAHAQEVHGAVNLPAQTMSQVFPPAAVVVAGDVNAMPRDRQFLRERPALGMYETVPAQAALPPVKMPLTPTAGAAARQNADELLLAVDRQLKQGEQPPATPLPVSMEPVAEPVSVPAMNVADLLAEIERELTCRGINDRPVSTVQDLLCEIDRHLAERTEQFVPAALSELLAEIDRELTDADNAHVASGNRNTGR
jgi:hypothetical protein